ncbi:MAG: hypothetical protein ABEJ85_00355 [Haloarculaceae archaeon]
MLTLQLEDFLVEFEDGAVKHVGPKTQGATAKLYHVEAAEAREFGDSQVKLGFEDGEGNEVEIALDPDAAAAIADDIERLREEGVVFE